MTKQEIETLAVKEYPYLSNDDIHVRTKMIERMAYVAGANMVNEKQPYAPADMEAFWRWADANGWYYGELGEMWYNDDEELEALKIEDVLKLWEGEK